MGICASTEHLEQQGQETEENIVYVMDEQGGLAGDASSSLATRKVASLFSQKGKKGPNQDSVILCQVLILTFFLLHLCLSILLSSSCVSSCRIAPFCVRAASVRALVGCSVSLSATDIWECSMVATSGGVLDP